MPRPTPTLDRRPLPQMWYGMDPNGIKEVVIEFDTGDEDIIKPRLRDEFESYELWETANYLGSLSHRLE